MNHKRKKPKNSRGGCLMCKYWKVNGFATERQEGERFSDHKRRLILTDEDILELKRRESPWNNGNHDRLEDDR